ncbi:MAG: hypothetical protein JSU94_02035 [Phycisphaerales bacterium]|nr:MAG: hypothetical protein JSU94_02035 [Phycisphaerales bacterium]
MAHRLFSMSLKAAVTLSALLFCAGCALSAQEEPLTICLVTDETRGPAARHGFGKLEEALRQKGISVRSVTSTEASPPAGRLIIAGIAGQTGPANRLHDRLDIPRPQAAESLLVRHVKWAKQDALLISAADDRGLMYALLDVADRVAWATNSNDPLSEVLDTTEQPAVAERALSMYTMHQGRFESFFYDESYWARYLDMLAKNRFNTFALLFGYENWGYFSPPYPYFFNLPNFPDVKVVGITEAKQRRNLEALNRVIEMTHERGMNFTLGIWDHIYRGGVQGPTDLSKRPTDGIVWGLSADNLNEYTKAALAEFLRLVPGIDAIQFRMHGESGLKRSEMESFWTNVYQVMKESGGHIRFDARAKNFPDSLIDRALEMGVDIRICTKYWMEQMGLPFHPTHVHPANQRDRRHGYADLLRYPQRYKMHWRLWNCGTARVLLWGDPEYVRRFADSTHLYNGDGFEVVEPLATKMQDHPHDMRPFELLKLQHRYYDYEFERYWHFFQLFGRLGYNPDTPAETWRREFEKRFGKEAGPYVEEALHKAGRILPRIVAYNYPYNLFPTTRGWIEKQRMKDLPEYAKALPSDTEQFLSMEEAASRRLEGRDSAKIWPEQSSRWFHRIGAEVLSLVEQAEDRIGRRPNKEFESTVVDLRILANLALYHGHRSQAGAAYALFTRSRDLNALDDAIAREKDAIGAWEKLVAAAGDFYCDNMMMGRARSGLSGHWRDELAALKKGLDRLEQQRRDFKLGSSKQEPAIVFVPVRRISPAENLIVRATVSGKSPITEVTLHYRSAKKQDRIVTMERVEPLLYRARIPKEDAKDGLRYFILAVDETGRRTRTGTVALTVTADNQPPSVKHRPPKNAPAQKPLTITVKIDDPSGVKWVRLRYRSVNQTMDYRTLAMTASGADGLYQAVVPSEHIAPEWDFMYFFEVMDNKGNGKIYPDLEDETPYIVVELQR